MYDSINFQEAITDAYAAVATPPGRSGVALIRLAGADATKVADRIFRFGALPMPGAVNVEQSDRTVTAMKGYSAALGYIVDHKTGNPIDQAVLLRYRAPYSYTGEDIVEFSVHGGSEVSRKALLSIFAAGARSAQPGEFTRNAFLNGKLDLAQAEAVIDLIDSETGRAATAALNQLQGGLSADVRKILDDLYYLLSALEMSIEYPDHEDSRLEPDAIFCTLEKAVNGLTELKNGYRQGAILRDGLKVVLTGPPNVGKSSVLNRLSGTERSIVTDIPGTTRDTIVLDIELNGIPVQLTDTAGLRSASDVVEQIGIERAQRAMQEADIILWLMAPPFNETQWFSVLPKNKPLIIVANKDDLPDFTAAFSPVTEWLENECILSSEQLVAWEAFRPGETFSPLTVSAKTGSGFDTLTDMITALYQAWGSSSTEQTIVTSARHFAAICRALEILEQVHGDLIFLPQDILAQALKGAAEQLALIVGDNVSDEVIDQIFTRFCVGK